MSLPVSFWRVAARGARDSLLANLVPFFFLQGAGVLLLVSYYGFEPTRALWDELAQIKVRGGLVYSALSTSFFAGLLPFVLGRFSSGTAREQARNLPWLLLYWAWHGCVVDIFYRSQAILLGDNAQPSTIVAKVLIDQFAFTPLLSTPMVVLAYAWKDCGYSPARFKASLGKRWYVSQVLPVLGPLWMVWIPALSLIYALPLALQLPVANLVQALWSLLLLFLTRQASQARAEASPST